MTALAKAYGRILEACGLIAGGLVLAMTALIVADVVLRNRFNMTVPASVELTEYALFYASTFAAPWLLRRGQHVRIDTLLMRVPKLPAWIMEIACDIVGLALSLLLSWYSIWMLARSMKAGTLVVKNLDFS
jgi:TRAP-type transport system small permease protein